MEKFNFPHSQKCIPIPSQTVYKKQLLAKTGDFLQRLRWKTFFHLNPNTKPLHKETYGFRTYKSAPQIAELTNFEKDLADLIVNTKFTNFRNNFQRELKQNVEIIQKTDNLLINADKTSCIYKVSTDNYHRLLTNSITKDYKQTTNSTVENINNEAGNIADKLELSDRIEKYSDSPAYLLLKDHKDNFDNDPKCRLINPAKTNIGKISKQLLQEINREVREKTGLTQWQSTGEVLNWFKDITHKDKKKFMQMDIVDFYPSITKELLDKAMDWASTITPIQEKTKAIISHARRSLLFSRTQRGETIPWTKKNGEFDITMGAPDGAEACELVGLLLLKDIKERFPQLNMGLYRDDGLATHNTTGGREMEKTRQGLHQLFKEHGLRITFEPPNLSIVNFLDVKMNITTGTYSPYRKPNDETKYVNAKSNHPPSIIRGIPKAVNKRLSTISSSKKEFDEAKEPYQKALNESGYKYTLKFEEPTPQTASKNRRRRNIIWYNPPWNEAVKTNVGKQFLALIDKHFPKSNPLHTLLNRNTVKISYSCTKNIKAIIQTHNAKILNSDIDTPPPNCNCQKKKKDQCPLNGNCQGQVDVVYHAKLLEGEEKEYIGSTVDFKKRFYSHNDSFRNPKNKNSTTLSTHIWENGLGPEPKIKWSILTKATSYRKGNRQCDLCLTEKVHIMRNLDNKNCLNKRSELATRCRHKEKFLLQPTRKARTAQ